MHSLLFLPFRARRLIRGDQPILAVPDRSPGSSSEKAGSDKNDKGGEKAVGTRCLSGLTEEKMVAGGTHRISLPKPKTFCRVGWLGRAWSICRPDPGSAGPAQPTPPRHAGGRARGRELDPGVARLGAGPGPKVAGSGLAPTQKWLSPPGRGCSRGWGIWRRRGGRIHGRGSRCQISGPALGPRAGG